MLLTVHVTDLQTHKTTTTVEGGEKQIESIDQHEGVFGCLACTYTCREWWHGNILLQKGHVKGTSNPTYPLASTLASPTVAGVEVKIHDLRLAALLIVVLVVLPVDDVPS